jgi:decaprenylphospho-beta-D-erythro-pentofuranosid-2-ulose 2-reductase
VIDALGAPASVFVLGGASELGEAIVARMAEAGRLERVVLAARPSPRRDDAAARLGRRVSGRVEVVDFDAVATDTHADLVDRVFAGGDIDVVVVAAGVLPDQQAAFADPAVAVAAALANYVGPMSVTLSVAQRLRAQGHGLLVVLSSVAAERPRRGNYVYGSTKAGLDAFATGLGDDLHGSGVRVLVVRPGFVTGRMTAGMKPAPFATTPGAVADAVVAHVTDPTGTVWVPGVLRYAMSVLRHLPRAIFRRLPQ